ncbi:hypothetical protein K402DRAFT_465717 [Aulographum hederae CBS 113979]|uniref:Rhodopsin domain-containing protein n=1 Tax=Aulographum hederae CBS 113979 TaxID=1176131 RepID=A0A6G1GSC9_9PEZI|nr:hypothetical protein K402DRAFT_465717 [Aulographum hederae CBS 113979]
MVALEQPQGSLAGDGSIHIPIPESAPAAPNLEMVVAIVMALLAILYVRLVIVKHFGVDDALMVLALVCSVITSVTVTVQGANGNPVLTPSKHTMKSAFTFNLIYWIATWAVKMSVLFFCYGVFVRQVSDNFCRKTSTYTIMFIVSFHALVMVFLTPFSCGAPLRFEISLNQPGCINLTLSQIINQAISLWSDCLVFTLPVILVWRTQIDKRKKIYLIGIFMFGSLSLLASTGRFIVTIIYERLMMQPDKWSLIPIFTCVEINVGICAASLPSLSPLIKSAFRSIKSRTKGSRSGGKRSNEKGSDLQQYNMQALDKNGIRVDRTFTVKTGTEASKEGKFGGYDNDFLFEKTKIGPKSLHKKSPNNSQHRSHSRSHAAHEQDRYGDYPPMPPRTPKKGSPNSTQISSTLQSAHWTSPKYMEHSRTESQATLVKPISSRDHSEDWKTRFIDDVTVDVEDLGDSPRDYAYGRELLNSRDGDGRSVFSGGRELPGSHEADFLGRADYSGRR